MLGEKRSQAMFGQGTQMAASGSGQEKKSDIRDRTGKKEPDIGNLQRKKWMYGETASPRQ